MNRSSLVAGTLLVAALAVAGPAHAGCAAPATSANVQTSLESAEQLFANLDVPGFRAATDRAFAAVPCVTDPIPRHLAAQLHRFAGLRAFVDRKPDVDSREFAAARSIEPDYVFPEALVPPGNPVLTDYTSVDVRLGRSTAIPQPLTGTLTLDGRVSTDRPTSWSTIVQILDQNGKVTSTAWVYPTDAMPAYTPKPPPPPKHPARVPIAVGAGACAIAAVTTFVLANQSHTAYQADNPPILDPGELGDLRTKTNTLWMVSVATGVLAIGLGTTTVFVSAAPGPHGGMAVVSAEF